MAENREVVIPRLRPLRYDDHSYGAQPQEKGIDVQLAISVIESVLLGSCDVAILISNDTDLAPVVETVRRLKGAGHIETASWRAAIMRSACDRCPAFIITGCLALCSVGLKLR